MPPGVGYTPSRRPRVVPTIDASRTNKDGRAPSPITQPVVMPMPENKRADTSAGSLPSPPSNLNKLREMSESTRPGINKPGVRNAFGKRTIKRGLRNGSLKSEPMKNAINRRLNRKENSGKSRPEVMGLGDKVRLLAAARNQSKIR